jgi:hypothetical protein
MLDVMSSVRSIMYGYASVPVREKQKRPKAVQLLSEKNLISAITEVISQRTSNCRNLDTDEGCGPSRVV